MSFAYTHGFKDESFCKHNGRVDLFTRFLPGGSDAYSVGGVTGSAFYFIMLIYTAASGNYIGYANIWRYCVSHSYPEYDCRCDEITEVFTAPYAAACYRLINDPDNVIMEPEDKPHDYIYVTDVDMLILRESKTIEAYHRDEMRQSGLCYSNTRRNKEPMGDKRVTGLHFASREWYVKTAELRRHYMHMLYNNEIGNSRFDDELMLNQILVKARMPVPVLRGLSKRHHGIHLGTVRAYINHPRGRMNSELRSRITRKQAEQLVNFYKDQKFVEMVRASGQVIQKEMQIVYAFCMRMLNE